MIMWFFVQSLKNLWTFAREYGMCLFDLKVKYARKEEYHMGIIENLYYGNVDMQDTVCDSESYRAVLKELITADLKLREVMSEEQTALYDAVKECSNRLSDVIAAETFSAGFRLGARLMTEIYGTGQ